MQQFIGIKLINALPMSRQEYNDFRGWEMPSDENGDDEGYLIEYLDGGKANTEQYANYVSWSPAGVFEHAYRQTDGMSFGLAVEAMNKGMKVARSGWNGDDMYALIMPAFPDGVPANKETALRHNIPEGSNVKIRPYFVLKTAQDDIAMWSPSGSDALADDWEVVD